MASDKGKWKPSFPGGKLARGPSEGSGLWGITADKELSLFRTEGVQVTLWLGPGPVGGGCRQVLTLRSPITSTVGHPHGAQSRLWYGTPTLPTQMWEGVITCWKPSFPDSVLWKEGLNPLLRILRTPCFLDLSTQVTDQILMPRTWLGK